MPGGRPRKGNRWYSDSEGTIHVKLTNTSEEFLCDPEDWERLKKFTWFKTRQGYVRSDTGVGYVLFHTQIVLKEKGTDIDHINGNPLDNRKINLRVCSHRENCMNQKKCKTNTSGVPGVSWYQATGKWKVQIVVKNKRIHLGYFNDLEDAARCRREAEEKYFGTFRRMEV